MDLEATFENMGPDAVRLEIMTGGFNLEIKREAVKWLAQRELEERSRIEASQSWHKRMALKANRTAMIAAIAAIAAVILTIIAIVISVLAWLYPAR